MSDPKPRTNSISEIERWVAFGYAQSPANCRILLEEIHRLRAITNQKAAA